MSSAYYRLITNASDAYSKVTGINITTHPLAIELQVIDSPDEIFRLLNALAKGFKGYQEGSRHVTGGLRTIVYVSHTLSGIIGEAVGLVRH